ncbi:MAG TPA: alpha/beta fold hydrolase [Acidimicrobiales bacterium]|nr:alpha/beta fold hydrolase [Acidimicrobiales bacterium]
MRPDFTPSPTLYPFESRWLRTSAGDVHYVDEGQGTPLLFLHGNPTWSFLYRHLIGSLREEFRCVAVDYPGFGLSDRPSGYGYTPGEHAGVVGELIDRLGLDGLVVVGHDWGGPIGLSVAAARADRVAGLVLGNTWFWPSEGRARVFSAVMSSRPAQKAILERNFFVERFVPQGVVRQLDDEEMEHYRAVQPTPAHRVGVAALPRQIVAARPWLEELSRTVPARLGDKRALITWPLRDMAFPARRMLPRARAAFRDVTVVELPRAKHYFQEDCADEVTAAISERFSSARRPRG